MFFHNSRYLIHKDLKNNIKIIVISDIHFSYRITNKKLNKILEHIKKEKPDYIFVAGDIVDSLDMIVKEEEKNRLINFMKDVATIAKTIMILGNHDIYRSVKNKNLVEHENYYTDLSNIENAVLLRDSYYEDNNILVYGLFQEYEYYKEHNKEDLDVFVKEVDKIKTKKSNKLKFILIHSPNYLINKSSYITTKKKMQHIYDKLSYFDYFITGHMHNGCVPPIINELIKGNKGIISPMKKMFPKNTRNTITTIEDKLLVNGPITTFHEKTKILQIFNIFYPINMSILEFKKSNKEDIKVQYEYSKK